ncbi:MAG: endonuclease/exonuclease/phosphatase family protein [Bacteroidetes bacterium]|nr:endonuclease/exonuclease/phosphatase family protein [Bacteroidota bacterium]
MKVYFVLLAMMLAFTPGYVHGQSADTGAIRIMTWNIKMLPRIFRYIHHKPVQRAKLIPRYIIAENTDVVLLQEAFDDRCYHILKRKLRKTYPYVLGPVNKEAGTIFSGGAMIFSKTPLKKLEQIRFSSCSGNDCWARKGALLAATTIRGQKIQVMSTHIQAGGIPRIHIDQFAQIAAMLQRHAEPGVPQILGGDYNTFRTDTVLYPAMLDMLKAEDGPISGDMHYTSDDVVCDMSENYCKVLLHPEQDIIDYILYKPNGRPYRDISRHIFRYTTPWDLEHQDLSDHMTLIMDLKL